jgi:hypothetical protein
MLVASDNIYYVETNFALISAAASYTRRLPQKADFTQLGKEIAAKAFQKPSRLIFHSLPLVIRREAFRLIPDRKGTFQVGVMQECLCLLWGQGAIRYESFN